MTRGSRSNVSRWGSYRPADHIQDWSQPNRAPVWAAAITLTAVIVCAVVLL